MNAQRELGAASATVVGTRAAVGAESWLFTLDAARLARANAAAIGLALVAGVVLAAGIGLAPLTAGHVDAAMQRQLYSMHGVVMVFLVLLPAIPAVLGNAWLPAAVGVERMAWPRVNLFAFHLQLAAAVVLAAAALLAPLDVGWSLDVPFATLQGARVAAGVLAIVAACLASACGSANVIATIARSRAGERSWHELPCFAWALGLGALVQVVAAPVLAVLACLLLAQRAGASDLFGAHARAADVAFASWFWAWAQAAFTAVLLATLGALTELVERSCGARVACERNVVRALVLLTVLAGAGSGAHLFGRSGDAEHGMGASALALLGVLPVAVLAATWWKRLRAARARASTALFFALAGCVLACAGTMAGLVLAVAPTGAYLANTTFETARMHLLACGTACAFVGGLYELWPAWFAAPESRTRGRAAAVFVLGGALLAFAPQFVLGYLGQPQRDATVVAGGAAWSAWSVAGAVFTAAALLLAGWDLLALALAGHAEETREYAS